MSYCVFLDLDGTLIKCQSQRKLIIYLYKIKKINLFFVLFIYLWFFFYKIGFISDVSKIMRYFFNICKGWSVHDMDIILNDFFNKVLKYELNGKILKEIEKHKANGATIIIISNAIYPLVNIIKEYLNIDYILATGLQVKNNFYTGKIDGIIIYGLNKTIAVKEFLKNHNLNLINSYCYADHYSDLYLFNIVNNPIAVNPELKLLNYALKNNWSIIK